MNTSAYLTRLDYHGPTTVSAATLSALHAAHMLAVPFENLDIGLSRPIVLDEAAFFDKIVHRGRGGFCFELNGLFAALLRELGFTVDLLSAQVYVGDTLTPEFDHLALLVRLDEPWLADVGFGDGFLRPLRLETGDQHQPDRHRSYRLLPSGAAWRLEERIGAEAWQPVYSFTQMPRRLADFAGRCHWLQTAPESHFTQQRVCSWATPTGRLTLRDRRLLATVGLDRTEHDLPDDDAFNAALREHFAITGL